MKEETVNNILKAMHYLKDVLKDELTTTEEYQIKTVLNNLEAIVDENIK